MVRLLPRSSRRIRLLSTGFARLEGPVSFGAAAAGEALPAGGGGPPALGGGLGFGVGGGGPLAGAGGVAEARPAPGMGVMNRPFSAARRATSPGNTTFLPATVDLVQSSKPSAASMRLSLFNSLSVVDLAKAPRPILKTSETRAEY